jgi:putative hydrolase of the HAD superfamily
VTFRAVVFDAGDTLIRLRAPAGTMLLDAAVKLGAVVPATAAAEVWQRVLAGAGTPEELAKGRDLSRDRHRAVWTDLYARAGADDLAVGLSDALYELTVDPGSWEAFPDTAATLRELRHRGVPVGVVSDTGFDLRPVFHRLELSPSIDVFVLSCEYGACKPEPRVFRHVCAELGVDPAVTLMVGDNPLTDGGATAAGLAVLLLPAPDATGPRGLHHVLSLVDGAGS